VVQASIRETSGIDESSQGRPQITSNPVNMVAAHLAESTTFSARTIDQMNSDDSGESNERGEN
jgi:hypothetical protein